MVLIGIRKPSSVRHSSWSYLEVVTESVWLAKHRIFTPGPLQIKFANTGLGGQVYTTKENNHRASQGCRCSFTSVLVFLVVV